MDEHAVKEQVYLLGMFAQGVIRAMGMMSENMQRVQLGQSIAYNDKAFNDLIEELGIHHNAIVSQQYGR